MDFSVQIKPCKYSIPKQSFQTAFSLGIQNTGNQLISYCSCIFFDAYLVALS